MPRSDCIEFTDHLADNGGFATARHSRGYFLSQKLLIILGISAVLLVVVVGLIAHFVTASGCQGDCSGEQGEGQLWSQCARLAQLKGSCICANTTLPTAVAPTARPQKLDVRIPGDLKAIHYNIKLRPDIYSADPSKFRFYGYSRVYMECQKATKTIMLHILKLTIDGASIVFAANDSAVVAPKFVRWEHDKKREFFVGHLDRAMEAGKVYYLEMKYTGPLTTDLSGLYLSKYTHSGNQTTYIATSQLQPTSARKVFPSFDEPGLKATFDITLTRKDPMKSLSNMELVKTVINEELPDWKDDIYDRTPVMSTYLLAMIVCDFEHVERKTSKNTVVRIWARPEAKTQTAYADRIGANILEYFEAYFDIDFPLKKIDMIAIPDFSAGAMENWGLITYRETALLYDSKISSQSNKQRVAIVVAHELAHQWFGNLVTPAWWDDIWLNEGFASYVEYLGVDKVAKEFKMFDQFLLSDTQGALTLDGLSHSHPIYVNVGDPSEIDEIFDAISYSKGACVIRMIDYFLGEENFKKGVTQYLKEHQYGSAAHTDLFKALTKAAAEGGITDGSTALDVTEIMFTWIKQMGYPVVTISRTGAGTARATQEHFLIDPNSKPDPKYPTPYNYKWYIPLSFTSNETSPDWSANKSSVIWMKMNDVTLRQEEGFPSDSQNWVIGNIGQYGFYRVNYDAENWEKLIGQLQYDHTVIDVKNRAQLMNDAFNLARAERLETGVPLRLSDYLKKEKDYLPWESYDSNIFYVDSMLERSALYGKFTTVMEEQVQDLYTDLGWTVKPGESFLDKYLRNIAIYRACYYGNKHCLDESTKEFASWVKNPATNPINVDLKTTVYCNAIRYGGVAEWEFAFDQYQKTNVASEKSKLMAALSCTKIPWILHRYLNFSLDENKIRKQDAVGVITGIANNAIGRCFAWDFFRANWDTIFQRYGVTSFSFPGLVTGITRNFNTKYELEQLEEIIAKHPNLGSGQRSFELAVERTKNNIRWVQRNEKEINVWLASR